MGYIYKRFIVEGVGAAIFFDAALSPYMLHYINLNQEQYISWLISNSVIAFFIGKPSVWFINTFSKLFIKDKD